jgi:hypothetical protein
MTVLSVLILASILFCLFLTGLIVNAHLSVRALARQLDSAMTAGAYRTVGDAVGVLAYMVNRGFIKVVIHIVCGLGTVISAIVAIACLFIYLASHTSG